MKSQRSVQVIAHVRALKKYMMLEWSYGIITNQTYQHNQKLQRGFGGSSFGRAFIITTNIDVQIILST